MGWHKMFILLFLLSTTVAHVRAKPKHDCQEKCGNISIPYPFGIREGCFLNDSYRINCKNSNPPFLWKTPTQVIEISLEGLLRVLSPVAFECYDQQGNPNLSTQLSLRFFDFPLSSTRNKFTAIGCATSARILGRKRGRYRTGCVSVCDSIDDVINGSCSGIGCCQTSIPKGLMFLSISLDNYYNHTRVWNFSKCSYAFVVEEDKYKFSLANLDNLHNLKHLPVVLDWAIGEKSCIEARKNKTTFGCQQNSLCYDPENGSGYRCNCSMGYLGNPYLPDGCLDINECDNRSLNECTHNCSNTIGSYTCSCPKGYHGDGRESGQGCIKDEDHSRIKGIIGISVGISLMLVINLFIFWGVKKRHVMKRREILFRQNGGVLLKKLLFENQDSTEIVKIFTEEELNKATNNFNENNVVGQGGYGTVYKGTLANNNIVAIKKSKVIDRGQISQFINEMIILSRVKHPNVVKLLGCCLETPIPLLVYEYITNKTLFHHLHDQVHVTMMPWKRRLNIAIEITKALAHMHSNAQIIHRDVKSANILLDDEYTAKVSDFGLSRIAPLEKTHLSTLVKGTIGYIDPEYFRSGNLTEKSDVYSFGVVLVELLTGQKVHCMDKPEWDEGLAMYFVSSLEENRLFQVLEDQVKIEGFAEQLKAVAELAKNCLKLKGEDRPTMTDVMKELEELRKFYDHL